MSDFVSEFWNLYVMVIVGASIVACLVILITQKTAKYTPGQVTGHAWDENLEEYNNPLPAWWSYLFYITCFFAVGYLILYPGFVHANFQVSLIYPFNRIAKFKF